MFQSMRPCRARPAIAVGFENHQDVSIHAPVQGATGGTSKRDQLRRVSIHAPVQGATCFVNVQIDIWVQFQSTRPCRARRVYVPVVVCIHFVSIHAPVQGATQLQPQARAPTASFNPRARAGRDQHSASTRQLRRGFQSTRPCRARLGVRAMSAGWSSVSIHAPVQGATTQKMRPNSPKSVSIHAPVQGATNIVPLHVNCAQGFNPRARAGRDLGALGSARSARRSFQSTRPCRARPAQPPALGVTSRVSIHAPVQGATLVRARLGAPSRVSIHAPVQGATGIQRVCPPGAVVSIHAPVQGATEVVEAHAVICAVSIHAPVQGATHASHRWWP